MGQARRQGMLVVLPGGLGDLVQARDTLEELAVGSTEPTDLLTLASLASLAESWGVFRQVVEVPAETLYHGGLVRRARMLVGLRRRLVRERYRACLILKAHPAYAFFAWLAGIPARYGFSRGPSPFLTLGLRIDPTLHRVERVRRLVTLATGRHDDPRVDEAPSSPPDTSGMSIGIAPGGARNEKGEMPSRRWPVDNYVELARALAEEHPDAEFFLFGSSGDVDECARVAAALPPYRVRNLCGTLPLEDLESAIADMHCFVTHDSGLMHMAGRTGCGLVGVFGPTDPQVVAPRRNGVVTLWQPASPEPCHDEVRGAVRCRYLPCCIKRVSVGSVLAAVDHLFQGPDGSAGESSGTGLDTEPPTP